MPAFDFSMLAHANVPAVRCQADIRLLPEHFRVNEKLPFEPSGEGGHIMLLIEKKDSNTDWVAKQLAQFAGVDEVAIGYAGMKDRHAVTTQWFSVNLEGLSEPDWAAFDIDLCRIQHVSRHNKKLKRGALSGNDFTLTLTAIQGDKAIWQQSLERIQANGVPNYFGEQRFGYQHANLDKADKWFAENRKPKKRHQRSIILSAARSWLFNLVLSERVKQNNWNQWLEGDVMQLAGTRGSFFSAENADTEIQHRLETFDIHPTGPLWGRGAPLNQSHSLALEQQALHGWQTWQAGLEQAGLKQERRPLRLHPEALRWQFEQDKLTLSFYLPAGSYATAVLRELAMISDASTRNSVSSGFSQ